MAIKQLGKYTIVEELGRGGFGIVYRASDRVLEREVALKVLHAQLMVEPDFAERFRKEAKLVAKLEHPNIVTIHDLGEEAGWIYIAMQYLPGGNLRDLVKKSGRIPFDQALKILRQIESGLSAAHGKGLVHRDIKPENILFRQDGQAVLTDFGLAKAILTSSSSSVGGVGTPFYRAPELWRGKPPASPATDEYSLACVFAEMLTGEQLFSGDTPDEVITKHLVDGPVLPQEWPQGVPQGLTGVIEKALAKDPAERYSSVEELVAALEALIPGKESTVQPAASKIPAAQGTVAIETSPQSEELTAPKEPAAEPVHAAKEPSRPALVNRVENPPYTPSKKTRWLPWAVGLGGLLLVASIVIVVLVVPLLLAAPAPTFTPTNTFTPAFTATQRATNTPHPTNTPLPNITPESSIWVRPADGMMMVYILEGNFTMGSPNGTGDDGEHPHHPVYLDAFWIDQSEVTNAMFTAFVNASGYETDADKGGWSWVFDGSSWDQVNGANWDHPKGPSSNIKGLENHPVVQVYWNDAQAYCEWAGVRLPTEAEWEKAARGGLEGKLYPWGDQAPTCQAGAMNGAQFNDCGGETIAVMTFSPNGYGLYDMAGNVWEWVNDWYGGTYYTFSPSSNPTGPSSGDVRVLRGGSWYCNVDGLRSAVRLWPDPVTGYDFGFRCARGTSP